MSSLVFCCSISSARLTSHYSKGERVTCKAHGGLLEIEGVTVATVNDQLQLQKVETWFDPLEMFRQMGVAVKDKGGNAPAKVDVSANSMGCPFKHKL